MDLELLKLFGLSNGEVKVYSAVLNNGISSINEIHEKTGFERRAIYDILNKLIEKGLVTYTIEQGKKTYQCASPNKLKEELRIKKDEIERFEKLIPSIEEAYKEKKPKTNIEVFRGKEGIKAVFEEMLNHKECYFIGGGYYIMDILPNYWPGYNKRRIKLGVKWFSLSKYETMKRKVPEKKLLLIKYLPEEFSGSPTAIFIFGNKVANVLWSEDLFAFIIENKEITSNQLKYHKYLWNNVAIEK